MPQPEATPQEANVPSPIWPKAIFTRVRMAEHDMGKGAIDAAVSEQDQCASLTLTSSPFGIERTCRQHVNMACGQRGSRWELVPRSLPQATVNVGLRPTGRRVEAKTAQAVHPSGSRFQGPYLLGGGGGGSTGRPRPVCSGDADAFENAMHCEKSRSLRSFPQGTTIKRSSSC